MREITTRSLIMNRADKGSIGLEWKKHFENRSVTQPKTGKLEVKAATDTMAEILLYDEIGYWGVTAQDFVTQLAQITAGTINVRINSPGGDVFDGLAIYQALKSHPATINTFVDGWAASAASFIALAGDTVTMGENAFMMIHKAWGVGVGNATDMRDLANTLDKIDGQLASIYAKKTGKSAAEMLALMAGESDGTWFTAAEAKAIGLADAVDAESAAEDANEKEAQAGALRRIANMRRRLNLAVHD